MATSKNHLKKLSEYDIIKEKKKQRGEKSG